MDPIDPFLPLLSLVVDPEKDGDPTEPIAMVTCPSCLATTAVSLLHEGSPCEVCLAAVPVPKG